MRLTLFAIIAILVIFIGGFVWLLAVANGMDPGDEEVRVEIEVPAEE